MGASPDASGTARLPFYSQHRRVEHPRSAERNFGCRSIRAKALSRDTSSLQCFPHRLAGGRPSIHQESRLAHEHYTCRGCVRRPSAFEVRQDEPTFGLRQLAFRGRSFSSDIKAAHPKTCHSERSRPTLSSAFAPANAWACGVEESLLAWVLPATRHSPLPIIRPGVIQKRHIR